MKRGLLTLMGALMTFATVFAANVYAATVTPTFAAGNPSCVALGYAYGLKPEPQNAPNGIYTLSNGVDTVTVDSNGTGLDSWSSTIGIDAVIVKGGPNANIYTYSPESLGDTNLVTPTNENNGNPYGLSHVEFCYDYEVQVSKTAVPSYTRTWGWTIDKNADATNLLLSSGQSYPVNYTVTLDASSTDSDYAVSGVVSVRNPDPTNATTLTNITDQISGLLSTTPVDCGVTLPYVLAAGATLNCTYTQALPNATSRVNTATVTTSGVVGGGSGSANIVFGAPTTVTDECVTVTDTNTTLSPSSLCAGVDTLPYVYSYTKDISYTQCGEHQYVNTASFITNDTAATNSDSWTVNVTVPCVLGCTLTQGYWKTHADITRKQYDNTWSQLSNGPNTTFYSSGKTWLQVFNTAPKGSPYYILAHQYMAAKLNQLNGADTSSIDAALSWANTWFSSHSPSSNLSKTEKQQVLNYAALLDNYNNGVVGPGHCSE